MGGEFVCFLKNRIIYTYDFGIFFHLTIYYEHSSKSIHTDLIFLNSYIIVHSVNEFSSVIQSCPTLCDPTDCSTPVLSITNFQSLFKFISIESVMPSNHLILCRPLLFLPPIYPSIRVFSKVPVLRSGGQSMGVSASASVLSMNIQDWFPLGLSDWISLLSKGLSRVFSSTTVKKHQFFSTQLSLWSNSHIHTWLLEKPVLTRRTFVSKVTSLIFNMLSRLVIAFLPRSKHLLISWL